jgi:hypothetical protein
MKHDGSLKGKMVCGFVTLLLVLFAAGCDWDSTQPGTKGRLLMYISDAPGEFDEVNLVVARVEVHKSGGSWFVVNDEERTFDLLELSNGAMAVLGDTELEPGRYTQIRLILSEGSNVVVDGVTHSLTIPSGFQTGYKLVHSFDLEPDYIYELLIDVDVHNSIHSSALGYMLKPTARVKPLALTGAIQGVVSPPGVNSLVSVIAADTVMTTAYPDAETGYFKFLGIPAGTFDLEVEANGYVTEIVTGVAVQVGHTTNVGTVQLTEE